MKLKVLVAAPLFSAALLSSGSALAQCAATGPLAGFAGLIDFASGASINASIAAINAVNTAFLTQTTAFIGAPANPRPNQEGGGVWVRGVGGEFDTKNTGTATFGVLGGPPVPGAVTCDTGTNLRFAGYQAGTDMARLNWNGWNIHIGSTVGYLSASVRDTTAAGPINTPGAATGSIDVPFAGMYAAATYGGFFIDGQVRFDYYQNVVDNPAGAVFNQGVDARGLSFTGNIGYHHAFADGWFIEPSAGIVLSKVEVDPFSVLGTAAIGIGVFPAGILQVGDINTALGRASLRGGYTIVTPTVIWQPFGTASVYHDFEGDVTSNFISAAPVPLAGGVLTGTLNTTNLGTYGQFAVGVAGQIVNTGWLGYIRADYRTGENIEGYSINGGIRYQFTPEKIALAPKGLIGKSPALPVAAPVTWSGFYIGAHAGVANGWTEWDFGLAGTGHPEFAGPMAGGQIGYDWQFGKWVVGLEGTGSWTDAKGAESCTFNVILFNCENRFDWIATATARVGYAYWDRALIYVKGGFAAAEQSSRVACNSGVFPVGPVIIGGCPGVSTSDTRTGYTAGFGTEFALARNWSVKGETNYFDFGRENTGGLLLPNNVRTDGLLTTIGVNYRFN